MYGCKKKLLWILVTVTVYLAVTALRCRYSKTNAPMKFYLSGKVESVDIFSNFTEVCTWICVWRHQFKKINHLLATQVAFRVFYSYVSEICWRSLIGYIVNIYGYCNSDFIHFNLREKYVCRNSASVDSIIATWGKEWGTAASRRSVAMETL